MSEDTLWEALSVIPEDDEDGRREVYEEWLGESDSFDE